MRWGFGLVVGFKYCELLLCVGSQVRFFITGLLSMKQKKSLKAHKSSSNDKGNNVGVDGKVVCVAVKASKEIPKTALVWALTHVVQPGDCLKLLLVIPSHNFSQRIWNFSTFISECTNSPRSFSGNSAEQQHDLVDSCSRMVVQLHDVYDPEKVKIRIKIISGSPSGTVAAEAKRIKATWVILDKQLKCEKRHCMEELQCNIVFMRHSGPEVLRLNFCSSPETELGRSFSLSPEIDVPQKYSRDKFEESKVMRGPAVTPASSPEEVSPLTRTEVGTTSISSLSDPEASPFLSTRARRSLKKGHPFIPEETKSLVESDTDTTNSERLSSYFTTSYYQPWVDFLSPSTEFSKLRTEVSDKSFDKSLMQTYGALLENLSKIDREPDVGLLNYRLDLNLSRSVREAISLCSDAPLGPPPLCSICQHKAPTFGKPPRWFTYGELELATGSFSQANFLAEGGFGSVYRGVLPDGQVVAVKQHKLASSQGDIEFCSEVEVLSCAQHRNVVMLIGLCVEDGRRLLVYEFICNRSLDSHLYGQDQDPLEWPARKKIAVGAARGLRYLHEECRVGCIIHRDMRPNNILLTHDFEPLVGDFGLARWQPDGGKEVETRVIGTFGYLAPEYAQSGQITEKADVYSFGVVLVELVTGRKAVDINRPKGQQCLTEWARPLLEKLSIEELVDPRLKNCYPKQEVCGLLQCASLCIRRDPHLRPRMSQVLRILEGDIAVNSMVNCEESALKQRLRD